MKRSQKAIDNLIRTRFAVILCFAILWFGNNSLFGQEGIRTRPDSGRPTEIRTSFFLIDVREIDGAKQTFTGDFAIRLRWKDTRLASTEKIRTLPVTAAWNPGLQLVNRVSVQTTLPDALEVDQDGNVLYRQRYIGQFSCQMDLKEFPFDRQMIPIRFAAPGVPPEEIRFVQDQTGIAPGISLTDWKILSWKVSQKPFELVPGASSLAGYSFEFIAKRQFHFFLVQIIIPMALIVGMSWIVFWLDPAQPGPRISISITSMLTIVAYRLLLGSFIPRLSFLTRMDYFVFGCTFLVFFALVAIVAITRLIVMKREGLGLKLDLHSRWMFPLLFTLIICYCFIM